MVTTEWYLYLLYQQGWYYVNSYVLKTKSAHEDMTVAHLKAPDCQPTSRNTNCVLHV